MEEGELCTNHQFKSSNFKSFLLVILDDLLFVSLNYRVNIRPDEDIMLGGNNIILSI